MGQTRASLFASDADGPTRPALRRTRLERILEYLTAHAQELELVNKATIIISIHGDEVVPHVHRTDGPLPR